ncbi:MAG: iron ABC transporter substrate-binding protein [Chloroflexi bacterium RBG_19FT_COMBO_47_9]|nr:MAG: iron ABC transporter substrate-binding protein [Chloroflexi bacterium RBG_13_48_10]OGO65483.1 MAG: iron ABC transporter substrate-binding protein [Chloroflexi bacterium RBG_19FT_COMBO_47_9]
MGATLISACAPKATEPAATQPAASDPMAELIAAAKAEGTLTTIALPHNWCNYGGTIEAFKAKYGIEVNELAPDGSSGDEIEAVKANKDSKGPQAPDVLDIGFAFGPQAKAEGLLQPYKVSTWDTIPAETKDTEGYWYGDYYGVIAFIVNTDVQPLVPQDWSDLLKPEYKGQVALTGDPRTGTQDILAVYASALANGGTLDNAQPGLEFWAQLNTAGNLIPLAATNALVAKGETPVRIAWDYNLLAAVDSFAGNPKAEVVIPKTGRIAGIYVQAISAYAPHPNAAKLWMEFLYSDEGQITWMQGYCHPIRETDMRTRGVIPADVMAKLPDVTGVLFPTLDQLAAAQKVITEGWGTVVGVDIQKAP